MDNVACLLQQNKCFEEIICKLWPFSVYTLINAEQRIKISSSNRICGHVFHVYFCICVDKLIIKNIVILFFLSAIQDE